MDSNEFPREIVEALQALAADVLGGMRPDPKYQVHDAETGECLTVHGKGRDEFCHGMDEFVARYVDAMDAETEAETRAIAAKLSVDMVAFFSGDEREAMIGFGMVRNNALHCLQVRAQMQSGGFDADNRMDV